MAYFILISFFSLLYIFATSMGFITKNLFQNTLSYALGTYTGEDVAQYALFYVFIISSLISFCAYFLYKIERIRPFFALSLFIMLVLTPFYEADLSKITLFFIILYLLVSLASFTQKHNKNATSEKSKLSIYLLPFCFFMSIFIFFVPAKQEPLQWNFVFTIIDATSEVANKIFSQVKVHFGDNSSYRISFTGYSDDGSLGGGVMPSDKIQLHINGKKAPQDIYLIGSIYDTYTGKGWEKTEANSTYADYKIDTYELIQALYQSDLSAAEQEDVLSIQNAELSYQDIYTQTVFYPQKCLDIDLYDAYKAEHLGANVVFKRMYLKDISYETKYITIDYCNPSFIELCRDNKTNRTPEDANKVIDYAGELYGNKNTFQSLQISTDMDALLSARSDKINDLYTILPSTSPTSIADLAHSLTDQYDNNYDKAKAVEGYLNSFAYTYIPDLPTENEDLVAYFLFESQSGFCTYFASSMAVLLRSIDIPTRYVEGFIVNYDSKISSYSYEVPAKNAHAWCEVYFDGIGWIPFEPTGKFLDSRYRVTENLDPSKKISTTDYSSYHEEESDSQLPYVNNETAENQKTKNHFAFLFVFLYAAIILFLFFISYYFILRWQRKKRYDKSDAKEKISLLMQQIILILELQNEITIDIHSPTRLFDDLSTYSAHLNIDWIYTKEIFQKQRFSPYIPTESDVEHYQSLCRQMEEDFFQNCKQIQKLYFKMFQTLL